MMTGRSKHFLSLFLVFRCDLVVSVFLFLIPPMVEIDSELIDLFVVLLCIILELYNYVQAFERVVFVEPVFELAFHHSYVWVLSYVAD